MLTDQQFFDSRDIHAVYDCYVVKVAFLLFGLLGENVAVISVSSLDLSRSGERKALL